MELLTKEGKEYFYSIYGCRDEPLCDSIADYFADLPVDLVMKALNYAAKCDEAHPDHDFIAGALWAMETAFEPMSSTSSHGKVTE